MSTCGPPQQPVHVKSLGSPGLEGTTEGGGGGGGGGAGAEAHPAFIEAYLPG